MMSKEVLSTLQALIHLHAVPLWKNGEPLGTAAQVPLEVVL